VVRRDIFLEFELIERGGASSLKHAHQIMKKGQRLEDKFGTSPHKDFYIDAIRCNWTPHKLSRYAKETFQEEISHDTFLRIKNKMTPDAFLPQTYKQSMLKNLEVKIDLLQEQEDLVMVQKLRLARFLQSFAQVPLPTDRVRKEIELMNTLLNSLKEMKQDLGLMPKLQQPALVDITIGGGDKKIADRLKELPADRARHIISIIGEVSQAIEENGHSVLSE